MPQTSVPCPTQERFRCEAQARDILKGSLRSLLSTAVPWYKELSQNEVEEIVWLGKGATLPSRLTGSLSSPLEVVTTQKRSSTGFYENRT